MAQRDSQLVIRARDEASKALQAINKALEDFVGAQADATKSSTATSSTFGRLAQSLADLGKAGSAVAGVAKISGLFDKAQGSVSALESKLALAGTELASFQERAEQAGVATAASAAKNEAAAGAAAAQAKAVAGLSSVAATNTREVNASEKALAALGARMERSAGGSTEMVESFRLQTTALEALRAKQTESLTALNAEKETLASLIATRKEATAELAAATKAQDLADARVKTATFNVANLSAGLEGSKGALGEIKTTFETAASKAGLMGTSVQALGAAQRTLKDLTEAATAAMQAQSRVSSATPKSGGASQLTAFQQSLRAADAARAARAKTAEIAASEAKTSADAAARAAADAEAAARARATAERPGGLARYAAARAPAAAPRETPIATSPARPSTTSTASIGNEKVRLDALRQSAEGAARAEEIMTQRASAASAATPAASATAAYRAQVESVQAAARAYADAKTQLEAMNRAMAAVARPTVAETAALNTQVVVLETARAALTAEIRQLDAFRAAARASSDERQRQATSDAQAASRQAGSDTASRLQTVTKTVATPSADLAPGSGAAATAAFRAQVQAASDATRVYGEAQARLEALYKAMSSSVAPTLAEKEAIDAQRVAWQSAQAAMERETAALSTMRAAIAEVTTTRRASVTAEREAAEASALAHDAGIRAVSGVAQQSTQMGLLQRVLLQVGDANRSYQLALAETETRHNSMLSSLKNLAGAYLTIFTAVNAFRDVVKTAADTEAAQVRISTALGQGAEAGAIAFSHAANAARALKLDILPTVNAYGQLLAVVKDTPLEGAKAQRVFDDLLVVMRAFKIAPENIDRVNIALRDMVARGNISKREITQLDQALPVGTFQALAQAAGFAAGRTDEFNKQIRQGKVGLDILVPAFDILANRARQGLPAALATAQSSFADFRNALFDFRNAIANGDFMQGIVDGINAVSKVIRDPNASAGLRGIANGFGEILSAVAAALPYARTLFVAITALTAVKLVSMISSFAQLRGLIAGVVPAVAALAEAFAALTIGGAVEGALGGVLAILTGPVGIAVAVAAVAGGIALWLTGTRDAEAALLSYRSTLDRVKDSLKTSGGDFTQLGQGVGSIQLTDVEKEVRTQRESFSDADSALRDYIFRMQDFDRYSKILGTSTGLEISQLDALALSFRNGQIPIGDLRQKIEDLNKNFKTDDAKRAAELFADFAQKAADASVRLGTIATVAQNAGSKMQGLSVDTKRASDATTELRNSVRDSADVIERAGKRALDDYGKSLDALIAKVPALAQKMKELKDENENQGAVTAGIEAINRASNSGKLDDRDVISLTNKLTNAKGAADAAATTQDFQKSKNYDDQVSEARQFLIDKGGATPDTANQLHPDFALQLAAAIKDALSQGIPLKVQTPQSPSAGAGIATLDQVAAIVQKEGNFANPNAGKIVAAVSGAESAGGNAAIVNSGTGATGLFQDLGTRISDLVDFLRARGATIGSNSQQGLEDYLKTNSDVEGQTLNALREINTKPEYAASKAALNDPTISIDRAMQIIIDNFERPGGSAAAGTGGAGVDIANARKYAPQIDASQAATNAPAAAVTGAVPALAAAVNDAAALMKQFAEAGKMSVAEAQSDASKAVGSQTWSQLSDNIRASLTSVVSSLGSLPPSVTKAAKTLDNITISEAIQALDPNSARRAAEAANVTAVPAAALPGAAPAPSLQSFGGAVTLSGIGSDDVAKKTADILASHGIYLPYSSGDKANQAQLIPQKLEDNPELAAALEQAKRSGDQAEVFRTLSPPGASKASLDTANADKNKDSNDALAATAATDKAIQAEQELLEIEKLRASVDVGISNFKRDNPDATAADIAAERQRLILKQQEGEVDADVAKFKEQHPFKPDPGGDIAAQTAAYEKQIATFRQASADEHAAAAERAGDNAAASDARHQAVQEEAQINALLAERRGVLKELAFATETGDDTKIEATRSKLDDLTKKIQELIPEAKKMWDAVGGADAAQGNARLNANSQSLENMREKMQLFGLSTKQTQQLVVDFANDLAGAFDTFAQELAQGVKPLTALSDAFRKFASDFLEQMAKMIIQTQIFKLLGITQSGQSTGGGLLGSAGGGLSFLGGLFGAHHTGGIVGQPTMYRNVSPLVFEGASRYHTGGVVGLDPDEVPIIAKKNEEVLTSDDPRHRDNQGGGASIAQSLVKTPRIVNMFDAPSFLSAALGAPVGEQAFMNFVRANAGAIRGAIGG